MIQYSWQLYYGVKVSEIGAILIRFEYWFHWLLAHAFGQVYLISPSLTFFTGKMDMLIVCISQSS